MCGKYKAASEHVVHEVDVLKAEKNGKSKDLSDFNKAKDNWVRAALKLHLMWDVPDLQWSGTTESGPRKENWQTR